MIHLQVLTTDPRRHACEALVVGVFAGVRELGGAAAHLDRALGGELRRTLDEEAFSARPGETAVIHTQGRIAPRRLIVAGLGPGPELEGERVRTAAAAAVRRAQDLHLQHLAFAPLAAPADRLAALTQARVEGILLGAYRFTRYLNAPPRPVRRADILAADREDREAVEQGVAWGRLFAEATVFARDLVNEPPSDLTPARFADLAASRARERGLGVEVLGPEAMARLGMGGILGVARGSREEPRLVVLTYAPQGAGRTVALVGKGLTFDSGGLDLKTAEQMQTMKSDMAGAAAVLATMTALPALAPRVRVLGLLGLAENMPGPGAMKPGDILRIMNGRTVEITNTDAEGRLVLADALAYAAERADVLIDIATLTGGAHVALGPFAAALLGTDAGLMEALRAAGDAAGERLWPLPLYEEYTEAMRGRVADLRNSAGRYGSAEKAAAFLREFTAGRPWAHLDIAPVAFLESEEGTGPYRPRDCATGFGVRTFLHYLARLETGPQRPGRAAPRPRIRKPLRAA